MLRPQAIVTSLARMQPQPDCRSRNRVEYTNTSWCWAQMLSNAVAAQKLQKSFVVQHPWGSRLQVELGVPRLRNQIG